jgi:hypothetical protein
MLNKEEIGQVNAIVKRDFNIVVEKRSTNKVAEPVVLGKTNDRGKMLINFYKQHYLVVVNTWIQKRSCT